MQTNLLFNENTGKLGFLKDCLKTVIVAAMYGMSAGIYGMGGGAPAGYGYPPGLQAMMTTAQPTVPTSLPPTTSNSSLGTLGVAASQAASLGLNPASKCERNHFDDNGPIPNFYWLQVRLGGTWPAR